jgi:PAS domain S-box-containing protein
MASTRLDDSSALLIEQARVLEMIVRGQPLPEVLGALCAIVERHAEPSVRAAILLVDASGKRLGLGAAPSLPDEYNAAIDGLPIDPAGVTCAAVAARGEIVITRDIATDPSWAALRHLPLGLGLAAAWSMPIMSSIRTVLGTFAMYFTEPREPGPAERRLLEVVAHTAALAIERNRVDRTLRDHAIRQRFLADLQAATQSMSEPSEVMSTAARLLAEHLHVDRCAYAEAVDERVFYITGDHARGVPSIVGRWEVAAFGPACVRDMLDGQPFVVEDVEHDPRITPAHLPAYRATTIGAVVCVPLHKGGAFIAAMAVHQTTPRRWSADEIDLVVTVAARCWEALERARVTRNLRDSEARYRAIVEATPECVQLIAADGTLRQINAAGCCIVEAVSEADVVGRSVYDWIAPEHRDAFKRLNEAVCRGEIGTLEFDIIGLAGTRRAMETIAVPMRAPDGDLIHLAVTRDVSARVAAERALADSRARLDYAVRLSGVGFWYSDLPFAELSWDARVKEHFFLPPNARVMIETFYDRIHPDDRQRTRDAIDASIRDRATYDMVYRTVDPSTGAIKWIRALGGTTYAWDGSPTRFDGVTVEVTAQKLDEEHLAGVANAALALSDELREQDRRKDEFLATLAHELRNPLAPIRTGLHVLRCEIPAEQAARTREMMERQLDHLVRMVDDLLDISRVTLGKIELKKERIDLRSVLDSALETTRPLASARGHQIVVRVPERPLPLDGDPTRLSQVFANLVNNAAKYTPDGGRITVAADTDGTALRVCISDTGIGIPADMLPYVFDMFTQVGHSIERSQGGLGIGLTLVRRLVEMHGGSVAAQSGGPGQGSSFVVKIPLAAGDPAFVPVAETVAEPATGLRILVVDDNIDAAESLAMLLELRGNRTRIAHTGPVALDAAADFRPQVVFLDIGLPGLNGYEVARRMRADTLLPQPLLVALTGWGTDEDRRQAHAAGFDRHLVKPVDLGKITAVLGSARRDFD